MKSGSASSPAKQSAGEPSDRCAQLINTINNYIANWNQEAKPFTCTAKPSDIIAKVRLLHRDFKKMLSNNS